MYPAAFQIVQIVGVIAAIIAALALLAVGVPWHTRPEPFAEMLASCTRNQNGCTTLAELQIRLRKPRRGNHASTVASGAILWPPNRQA
jgi:hypothetical protein